AGWLARASIAGLVAAATGVGVATTSGTAVTAGVGAAETATVDTATLSTSTAVPRKILGMSVKQAVAAAITTVVVIVGATIGANAYSNHQDKVKAEKAAAKKVAIEKAKVKAFAANAPSGKWNVVSTITSSDFDGDKIGQISTFTWTFDSTCEKYLCTGTISSSSGNKFPYTWDGKTIVREVVAPKPEARTCIDTATGIETKGTSAVVTVVYESAPLVAEPAGTPTKLVGDFTETNSYSQYVDCNASEPRKRVERFVATKS
ncbi:MAG: hypothetical protein JWP10_289, partial [Nocardioidaceae bacterium]|nr:hypothetical protein [Nocardioidaceae bacterium]